MKSHEVYRACTSFATGWTSVGAPKERDTTSSLKRFAVVCFGKAKPTARLPSLLRLSAQSSGYIAFSSRSQGAAVSQKKGQLLRTVKLLQESREDFHFRVLRTVELHVANKVQTYLRDTHSMVGRH